MEESWRDRAKRAMKGKISQETLAERLGTSQPGLSHWLNNRSQPSLDDINRIADEIGVSRIWLTHGLGPEGRNGKILLDLLLTETWSDAELEPLAVTAEALIKARRAGIPPAPEETREPAASGPDDLRALFERYTKDPASLSPESMKLLRKQLEREIATKQEPRHDKARKKAGGSQH